MRSSPSNNLQRHSFLSGRYARAGGHTLTPSTSRGNFTNNGIYTSIVANTDASTDRAQFVLAPLTPQAGTMRGLGGSNTVSASSYSPIFNLVRQYLGAYVQDSWKATPSLTLNYGLRWEFLGVPTETDGRFANFVPAQTGDTKDNVSRFYMPEKQVGNVPVAFQTLLASNGIAFTPMRDNVLGYAQKGNFAPRVGFSFQASPRLVLRAGYGLFYQGYENHGLSISPWVNYPFQITSSYTAGSSVAPVTADNSVGPLTQGLQNVPLTSANAALGALSLFGEPRYPKTTYSQAFNLQVQYQITPDTIAFAGYVGSDSRHVQSSYSTNTVGTILAPTANVRTSSFFPGFAPGGNYNARAAATNYNSLQAGVEHRFGHGFSLITTSPGPSAWAPRATCWTTAWAATAPHMCRASASMPTTRPAISTSDVSSMPAAATSCRSAGTSRCCSMALRLHLPVDSRRTGFLPHKTDSRFL